MKTAEEYLSLFEAHPNEPDLYHKAYVLTAMQAYAMAACREQREICAHVYNQSTVNFSNRTISEILNAPEPKML